MQGNSVATSADKGSLYYKDWFNYEFWRFSFVQQEIGRYAQTFLEYPPMQAGASFRRCPTIDYRN
jgi:arylsulfatase